MYLNALLKISILALTVSLSSCASVETAKGELGEGPLRVYANPFDDVWDAATKALPSLGISVTDVDKSQNVITGSAAVSASSWGERVALRVTKEGETKTKVEVVSKRALAVNVTATNWETQILDRIGDMLPGTVNAYTVLGEAARKAYEDFQTRPYPRAFVISEDGQWSAVWARYSFAHRTVANEALERCVQAGHRGCKLYAFNGDIVWKP